MGCIKAGDVKPPGMGTTTTTSGGVSIKKVPSKKPTKGGVQPNIIVQFRPNKSFLGKFGFDWLRLGDSGLTPSQVDIKYTDNMGYHTNLKGSKCKDDSCVLLNSSNFSKEKSISTKLKGVFDLEVDLTTLGKVSGLNTDFEYRIPVVTLMPKDKNLNPYNINLTAKLDTIINHGKLKAKSLRLAFKNKEDEKKAKNVISISSMSLSKFSKKEAITITSKGILKKTVILYVYADKCYKPCGAIKILRNDKVKQINVVFIGTKTKLDKKIKIQNPKMKEVKLLREKLGQALINVNLAIDSHPVTKTKLIVDMTTKFTSYYKITITSTHKKVIKDKKGNLLKRGTNIPKGTICLAWDKKTSSQNGQIAGEILDLLDKEFEKQLVIGAKLSLVGDIYKFYFINEQCYSERIPLDCGGGATVGAKHSMYFGSGSKSPLAHEVGHNLGLKHTFEQIESPYRYKYISTDNIMDYNHIDNIYYYWQWKIMNKSGIE